MKTLGIDFGSKRVGLALSDSLGMLASPLPVYTRTHYKKDVQAIVDIAKKNGCDVIVLGRPYHMNGDVSEKIKQVEEFAKSLKDVGGVNIEYIDERLTSVQGARIMSESGSKKQNIDSVCAAIILQTYLDKVRR